MKQRDNYELHKYYDQANNKNEQRCSVHAVHEFYIGISILLRVAFLQKKIFLYLSPDAHRSKVNYYYSFILIEK